MQKVFQMDKGAKEIPGGRGGVCAKAPRHEKIAQSVFGKHEQVQVRRLLVIRDEGRSHAGSWECQVRIPPIDL